jgi:hypothetical protein
MFKNISLTTKAIIFAIALGTLSVLGVGAMAYSLTKKVGRRQAKVGSR